MIYILHQQDQAGFSQKILLSAHSLTQRLPAAHSFSQNILSAAHCFSKKILPVGPLIFDVLFGSPIYWY